MVARATGIPGVAIERSPQQIEEALRQASADGETNLLTMREGDVLSPPIREGEWDTFDVAHARFVLEHVPNPATVVLHMARAVPLRQPTHRALRSAVGRISTRLRTDSAI